MLTGRHNPSGFGHGLSYTEFEYSNLAVARTEEMLTVTVDVANAGTRDGAEVVQLCTRSLDGEQRPLRKLAGFAKVQLGAGEVRAVTFEVPVAELAFWDEASQGFAAAIKTALGAWVSNDSRATV